MASRALLRRNLISHHLNISLFTPRNLGPFESWPFTLIPSQQTDAPVMVHSELGLSTSRSSYYRNVTSGPIFGFQFIRYASTSTKHFDQTEEKDSTAAKPEAKWLQVYQHVASAIMPHTTISFFTSTFRSMASMSRIYWARTLNSWGLLRIYWARTLNSWGPVVSLKFWPYWLGIMFLRANVSIGLRLLVKISRGNTLSRRERQLLSQTTANIFRLLPRSIVIVVPFIQFMLPLYLVLFPKVLSSNFREEAGKRRLKARIEYANFLQDTAREMAQVVQNSRSGGIKQTADDFSKFASHFFSDKPVSKSKVFRFAKLFNDEITLDIVCRRRLVNMCESMGITPYGSDEYLRFMLGERLKAIKKDDKLIQEKGVDSLSEAELHKCCRERGIHLGEEMRQQLLDWLDLSVNHSVSSSLLVLSRAFIVSQKKPEEVLLKTLSSLPYALKHTVAASLPSKDPILYKLRKLEYLDLQERIIEEEEPKLLKMKEYDIAHDDVALKELTIMTTNGAPGQDSTSAVDKQTQPSELSNAIAVLASALSLRTECEKFLRLVNKEIYLYNRLQDKQGEGGENETMKAHRGAREEKDQYAELNVGNKVSSVLFKRVDAMLKKIEKENDDVDAKIGERWRVLDRYCDGKVSVEVVAAAALYLKDTLDKEGIQELICNHSKYEDEIVKLGTGAEDSADNNTLQ